MKKVISLLVVFFCGCGTGSLDKGEFKDHPEKYKGETITISSVIAWPMRTSQQEAKETGKDTTKIYFYASQPSNFGFYVDLPASGVDVPDNRGEDLVSVTFTCTKGDLTHGNVITKAERWP